MQSNNWLESFVDKPFTDLTLIFALLFLLVTFNLLYTVLLNRKISIRNYILLNNFFLLIICSVLLFKTGVLVDKFAMSGSSLPFYFLLGTFIVFITHFVLLAKSKQTSK